jgi:hypothetical protein
MSIRYFPSALSSSDREKIRANMNNITNNAYTFFSIPAHANYGQGSIRGEVLNLFIFLLGRKKN